MTLDNSSPESAAGPGDGEATGFPVIGLGASAGGLAALETFFSGLPPDSGMAFVVVTHQHAGKPSLLVELLARKTDMPVLAVSTATRLGPDRVYVAAPGYNLTVHHGTLEPVPVDGGPALHLPIDYFFRSLARDQRENAVGVILSGTGSDGTLGLKEIKGELGMVLAQDEESAQYSGMPHSAIATMLVDHVLPIDELPGRLLAWMEAGRPAPQRGDFDNESARDALHRIFGRIREHTGHDFSHYKISTVQRRIARRMSVHQIDSIERYLQMLQVRPDEVDLLFRELLIGVTSFFRDPDAWTALAGHLRTMLADRPADHVVRAWVPGCSTAEEACSLAILLRECMDAIDRQLPVQIFATDLDDRAIDVARAGAWPVGIASDVSPQRLERFFTREDDSFRVSREIRDMLVFARHNVIADPPFTRLDILCCRNLLIYLDSALQKRLFPVFHYALQPDGLLLLGSSETIGSSPELFHTIDKKWKIYRRAQSPSGARIAGLPPAAGAPPGEPAGRWAPSPPSDTSQELTRVADRMLLRDLVPPTVLIREQGDVVYVHGRTGRFLEPAPGPPGTANVFQMAREGLAIRLSAAIRDAADQGGEVVERVQVRTNGDTVAVDLCVTRMQAPTALRGLFRITFRNVRPVASDGKPEAPVEPSSGSPDLMVRLERELEYTRESHRGAIADLESANEERQSTNEELQSTNEELQSANEELETSKEELQSLNEELQTVNAELQEKVDELSRANNDMRNLLNGTDIATLFLDRDLCIKRYTEQARNVIRLIPSDVGRPISDLVSTLDYDAMVDDAHEVLRTLVPRETEVHSGNGTTYLMRILPYRTTENVIDGLVFTFIDITRFNALQSRQEQLLAALRGSPAAVYSQDRRLRIRWVSGPLFGRQPDALVSLTDRDLFPAAEADPLVACKEQVLATGTECRRRFDLTIGDTVRAYMIGVAAMHDPDGQISGLSCVAMDLTPSG